MLLNIRLKIRIDARKQTRRIHLLTVRAEKLHKILEEFEKRRLIEQEEQKKILKEPKKILEELKKRCLKEKNELKNF